MSSPSGTSTMFPFLLRGKMTQQDSGWELKVVNGVHNHPTSAHLVSHSHVGRLTEEEKGLLVEMSWSFIRPKDILRTIKARSEHNVSTIRHIYNVRRKIRIVHMAGRSQMQYLMAKLVEHKYIEWHKSSGECDELIDLVWTHLTSIDLLRTFPTILIMDAKYKTKKYGLPLFEIVGEMSTGMTFMVAFTYLNSELVDNYHWVLDNLKMVMHDIQLPKVVVKDRAMALMIAVGQVWPIEKNCKFVV